MKSKEKAGTYRLNGKKGDPNRTLIWVRREGNFRYQGRAYYAIREETGNFYEPPFRTHATGQPEGRSAGAES